MTYLHAGLEWSATLPNRMPYADALASVEQMNRDRHSGHGDWRLPSISELISVIDYSRSEPATALPNTRYGYYWSASSLAPYPTFAWVVSFYDGSVISGDKTNDYHVRLVRGGCGETDGH